MFGRWNKVNPLPSCIQATGLHYKRYGYDSGIGSALDNEEDDTTWEIVLRRRTGNNNLKKETLNKTLTGDAGADECMWTFRIPLTSQTKTKPHQSRDQTKCAQTPNHQIQPVRTSIANRRSQSTGRAPILDVCSELLFHACETTDAAAVDYTREYSNLQKDNHCPSAYDQHNCAISSSHADTQNTSYNARPGPSSKEPLDRARCGRNTSTGMTEALNRGLANERKCSNPYYVKMQRCPPCETKKSASSCPKKRDSCAADVNNCPPRETSRRSREPSSYQRECSPSAGDRSLKSSNKNSYNRASSSGRSRNACQETKVKQTCYDPCKRTSDDRNSRPETSRRYKFDDPCESSCIRNNSPESSRRSGLDNPCGNVCQRNPSPEINKQRVKNDPCGNQSDDFCQNICCRAAKFESSQKDPCNVESQREKCKAPPPADSCGRDKIKDDPCSPRSMAGTCCAPSPKRKDDPCKVDMKSQDDACCPVKPVKAAPDYPPEHPPKPMMAAAEPERNRSCSLSRMLLILLLLFLILLALLAHYLYSMREQCACDYCGECLFPWTQYLLF